LHFAAGQLQRYPEALEEFEIVLKLDPQPERAKKLRDQILMKVKPAAR
jgi:hypothetical protein